MHAIGNVIKNSSLINFSSAEHSFSTLIDQSPSKQILSTLDGWPEVSKKELISKLLANEKSSDLKKWLEDIFEIVENCEEEALEALDQVLDEISFAGDQNQALILASAYRLARTLQHEKHANFLAERLATLVENIPSLISINYLDAEIDPSLFSSVFMENLKRSYSTAFIDKASNNYSTTSLYAGAMAVGTLAAFYLYSNLFANFDCRLYSPKNTSNLNGILDVAENNSVVEFKVNNSAFQKKINLTNSSLADSIKNPIKLNDTLNVTGNGLTAERTSVIGNAHLDLDCILHSPNNTLKVNGILNSAENDCAVEFKLDKSFLKEKFNVNDLSSADFIGNSIKVNGALNVTQDGSTAEGKNVIGNPQPGLDCPFYSFNNTLKVNNPLGVTENNIEKIKENIEKKLNANNLNSTKICNKLTHQEIIIDKLSANAQSGVNQSRNVWEVVSDTAFGACKYVENGIQTYVPPVVKDYIPSCEHLANNKERYALATTAIIAFAVLYRSGFFSKLADNPKQVTTPLIVDTGNIEIVDSSGKKLDAQLIKPWMEYIQKRHAQLNNAKLPEKVHLFLGAGTSMQTSTFN